MYLVLEELTKYLKRYFFVLSLLTLAEKWIGIEDNLLMVVKTVKIILVKKIEPPHQKKQTALVHS